MMMEKVGVEEEEPTKNYIKLVLCTWGGSGNNAKRSRGKSGDFIFEIECEPWPDVATVPYSISSI